ncbi:hypothetical protein O3P69_007541 [Scylla paramamosain]|uniref:Uncharacterized protein n=1 Tax=Scylla paramamosain TaxID=85552 RepID=A0AAW0UZ49_SCYPA
MHRKCCFVYLPGRGSEQTAGIGYDDARQWQVFLIIQAHAGLKTEPIFHSSYGDQGQNTWLTGRCCLIRDMLLQMIQIPCDSTAIPTTLENLHLVVNLQWMAGLAEHHALCETTAASTSLG